MDKGSVHGNRFSDSWGDVDLRLVGGPECGANRRSTKGVLFGKEWAMSTLVNMFYLTVMVAMLNAAFWSGAAYTYLKAEYEKQVYEQAQSDLLMRMPVGILSEITVSSKRGI